MILYKIKNEKKKKKKVTLAWNTYFFPEIKWTQKVRTAKQYKYLAWFKEKASPMSVLFSVHNYQDFRIQF